MNARKILKAMTPTAVQLVVVGALVGAALVGFTAGRQGTAPVAAPANPSAAIAGHAAHPVDKNGDGIIYVSPMHPQIQQDEPGQCPICGMDLVATKVDSGPASTAAANTAASSTPAAEAAPAGYACAMNCVPPLPEAGDCPVCGMEMQPVASEAPSGDAPASTWRLSMSPEAVALLKVETSEVTRGPATRELGLVGELVEIPQKRHHVSANIGGRVDVLHARFDRDRVEQGQPLAEIYSPELLAVQEELLQAAAAAQRWQAAGNAELARSAGESVAIIRRRLLLAGLDDAQIDGIVAGGKALDRLTLHSPVGGLVTARYVEQGQYVEREQHIVTVVDYGELWAELQAFNSDLAGLREGVEVTLTAPSHPDRTFNGTVAWLDPLVNPQTRTARVRVVVANADLALKPGMYVRGTASVVARADQRPLLVPHSAPLITGKRAVVYVQDTTADRPTFLGREVELGGRAREGYIVLSGLEAGERVVTRGAFQIDSSLQIQARPSMMNPNGGRATDPHAGHGAAAMGDEGPAPAEHADAAGHGSDVAPARALLDPYLRLQRALAGDDLAAARQVWPEVIAAAKDAGDLANKGALGDDATASLESMRVAFQAVGLHLLNHRADLDQPVVHVHCPMAFGGKGADWLQSGRPVANPYFGAKMLRCGTIQGEVTP